MRHRTTILAAATAALALGVAAAPASAEYHVTGFSTATSTTQAGGHPDLTVDMTFSRLPPPSGGGEALNDGHTRQVDVDLPAGLTGNPENLEQCTQQEFDGPGCPAVTQVGTLAIDSPAFSGSFTGAVWLMKPRNEDETARLATRVAVFNFSIIIGVRSDGDLGLHASAAGLPAGAYNPYGLHLTLWGVPADASHDTQRLSKYGLPLGGNDPNPPYDPLPYPLPVTPRAFMTNPTACGPQEPARLVARTFEDRDATYPVTAAPLPDVTGCDSVPFAPAFSFQPVTRRADSPSAFDATLSVPQQPAAVGTEVAHVRDVEVTLPEGVAISPPGADGLAACADADLRVGTADDATCPAASRLGSAEIDVPILSAPLTGAVHLRTPAPGHLFRLAIVARGSGVRLKVLGEAIPDPVTGRLRVVFAQAPQQPFSRLRLAFDGGPRAPLATPPACTPAATTSGTVTGWNGAAIAVSDAFAIDAAPDGGPCPARRPFAPRARAGGGAVAGASSTFTLRVARADGDEDLGAITATLPPGLLARLDQVPVCPEPQAAAGTCAAASRVGTTTVGSGSGPAPLSLTGGVHLTGPYQGAPFGLSIAVPTAGQAGPFDLGVVVVRAGIYVDRDDAHVTVKSDPLPTIIQGVPLRLRDVVVSIDRPGFMINPTSCAPSAVGVAITSASGRAAPASSTPFAVGDCAALGYAPRLALAFGGKGQTRDGSHPALHARLTPRPGDANTRRVRVILPPSMALDPDNAQSLCEPSDAAADRCPAGSIVGRAVAASVLRQPLSGPVYFVRGERKDPKTGRTIKTLPRLYLPLRGDGVRVDVRATSSVAPDGRLVTTFDGLPDVPLRSFDLQLAGGRHGILVVSGTSLCTATQTTDAALTGQSGKVARSAIVTGTPCALGVVSARRTATALTVTAGGVGAGRLTISGPGLTTRSRTLAASTTASLTLPLSARLRRAVARGDRPSMTVRVAFTPKGAKQARVTRKQVRL